MSTFYLPTKPYSLIDAINRRAAATGSVGHARATSSADYNGHALELYWNDYRGYYVCEYHWGERVVITRNERIAPALAAAKREFARQGRGASLRIAPRDAVDELVCRLDPELIEGERDPCLWMDWRFQELSLAKALGTEHLLIKAADKAAYDAAVKAIGGQQ